jgi:hypothetical protein
VLLEVGVPSGDLVDRDLVEHTCGSSWERISQTEEGSRCELGHLTVNTGVDQRNLDLGGDRRVLLLLEELGETRTTGEEVTGGGVEVGTELSEG